LLLTHATVHRHRYEVKQTQEELVFSHLRDYEMEVGVVRCLHLPVPKEIATVESYVYISFPYPKAETPQVIKSPSVTKSLDPGTSVSFLSVVRRISHRTHHLACTRASVQLCGQARDRTKEVFPSIV
jgi:hypothetical protein